VKEPTALLMDFGGVLTTNVFASFAAFCEQEGLDPQKIRDTFRDDPEARRILRSLETGEIKDAEFEQQFGDRLGIGNSEGLIVKMFAGIGPEPLVIDAVRGVHAHGIPTCLVSNSVGGTTYDHDLLAELFDEIVISSEVGLHKPQPEIYRLAADRVETATEQCVFVDDLRENCEGAEAVGMTAVLHRDPTVTAGRIAELFAQHRAD